MYFNDIRRKVFISYYHGDQELVNTFVRDYKDVFIAKTVGVKDGDFDFDSNNPEYIMRRIREEKLEDSTVTIVLMRVGIIPRPSGRNKLFPIFIQ